MQSTAISSVYSPNMIGSVTEPPENMTDQEKLTVLYQIYYQTLLYTAYGYLKDIQLAEDMVQETFIKVSSHLSCVKETRSKMTRYFLITIVRNKCIDYIRKKNRMQETLIDNQTCEIRSDDLPLEYLIHMETLQELANIISQLDTGYRVPLQLRYYYGLTNTEISLRTGLSVNLVAVRINRAKKMLRSRLRAA